MLRQLPTQVRRPRTGRPFQIADVHHRVGGIALAPFDVWLDVGWRHQPDLMCQGLLRLRSADTKGPSTDKDACVERGPHLGHNPVAAQTAVKAFLKTVFKLG